MERSLNTYVNKKGKEGPAPSSARRGVSPHAASLTPTTLLKGMRDPGRSYEDLLAESPPPPPETVSQPAHLHNLLSQTQSRAHQQQPWSLMMRRLLAQALCPQAESPPCHHIQRSSSPEKGGNKSESSPRTGNSTSPGVNEVIASRLGTAKRLLLSAVVRPLTPAEVVRGDKEVLVVAPDECTLLVARPNVFRGAPAEHVAAAAAAYGQSGWATRYKFHVCVKDSHPSRSPAGDSATAMGLEATASKSKIAIAALARASAEAVLGGQSSACFVLGARGSGNNACFLESAPGAADGLAIVGFCEVGK